MMALSWVTIALVGAAIIVASLSLGRSLLAVVAAAAAAAPRVCHDVYAFALGFCVCGSALEAGRSCTGSPCSVLRARARRTWFV